MEKIPHILFVILSCNGDNIIFDIFTENIQNNHLKGQE